MNPPEPPSHFDEPWQAQAFALVVSLAEAGVFSWADWTRALSAVIARLEADGQVVDGAVYPKAWVAALEGLATERGAVDLETLGVRTIAWREAYLDTPHGRPVVLTPEANDAPRHA